MPESRIPVLCQERIDELNLIFGLNKKRKKKMRVLVWDSALEEHELGDYQVIPLTSSLALRQEGRAMHHCVGGFDETCFSGLARVFSIRDLLGRRLATMSLDFRDDYWHLDQVKGFENAEVCMSMDVFYDGDKTVTWFDMTDMHYVAYEVLRCYRKVWEKNLLLIVLDAVRAGGKVGAK